MFWVFIPFPLLLMDATQTHQQATQLLLPHKGPNMGCLGLGASKISGGCGLKAKGRMKPLWCFPFSRTLKYSWCSRHLGAAIMPSFFYITTALLLAAFELIEIPLAGSVTIPCKWEEVNKSRQANSSTHYLFFFSFFIHQAPTEENIYKRTH